VFASADLGRDESATFVGKSATRKIQSKFKANLTPAGNLPTPEKLYWFDVVVEPFRIIK